tara:strand:- start:571 stop:894 length:324 start_codon:yes stop_codon:yes gene_type:complete
MSAIDKIKDHYNALDTGESKYFEAWDMTFCKSPMNMKQKGRLYKKIEVDAIEGLVYAIIELALDKQGKPAFKLEDKQILMNKADPDLLSELATWLMQSPSKKQVKKN